MRKFTGLNWTLIGLFLILFIIYGACRVNNGRRGATNGIYQSGGADSVGTDHSETTSQGDSVGSDSSPSSDSAPSTSETPSSSDSVGSSGTPSSDSVGSSVGSSVGDHSDTSHSGLPVPRACLTQAQATTESFNNNNRDDIRNPQYPVENIPSNDVKQNTIVQQRRLIREYQSYIKNLRGQCCRRIYSGQNLLDNPLSNKNWEVRPMIANGGDNAMNLMQDDFSNIMSISPADAEKYKVSFYDQEPAPPRTFALQASENWPMYQRTFDRSFVSRIPDAPNFPFKVTASTEWPGSGQFCPASKACAGTMSPPWTTSGAYTCEGMNFDKPRAPEPGSICQNRIGQPPPYLPNQSPPPASNQSNRVPTSSPQTDASIPATAPSTSNGSASTSNGSTSATEN